MSQIGCSKGISVACGDPVCGCAITAADRRVDLAHLQADLAKLAKIEAEQPKRWERNREQYDAWKRALQARITELEKETEGGVTR